MLNSVRSFLAVLLVVAMTFSMVACGTSTLITNLELISNAAAVAVPIIFATGAIPLTPEVQAMIVGYLQSVNTAVIQAGTELQSSDSQAIKASKIVGYFSSAVLPNLPPGTPQAVAAVINSVAAAVANFLAQLQPAPAPVSGTAKAAPAAGGTIPASLSSADTATLLKAVSKAANNLLALQAKK